tara:strand:- start:71 stop:1219 length:1149 start_codon:yes stop_codon:yes gene_type:complete
LNLKKKIYYWSPFLVRIATPRAVVNSAYAMQKFNKSNDCSIINFFGEFNIFKNELIKKNLKTINFFNSNILKFLPKHGKIQSRLSFILIFILSFFPLKKIISKQKPDFLIIHLITSLPLFLLLIFSFETKFILRISGLPKMGFFRKLFWSICLKKVFMVTCPSKTTLNYINDLNIVDSKKIKLLYDPIIHVSEITINKKKENKLKLNLNNYYFAAGRLTRQKNFLFLCRAFKEVLSKNPGLKLIIAGEGEDKNKILSFIKKHNLENNIFLTGYIDNIFYYMSRSKGFIISSLWEDPGFVLVESAFCRVPLISSDCETGPKELIQDKTNGILFKSNDIQDFSTQFNEFIKQEKTINKLLLSNLKMSKKFTLFNHYLTFESYLC